MFKSSSEESSPSSDSSPEVVDPPTPPPQNTIAINDNSPRVDNSQGNLNQQGGRWGQQNQRREQNSWTTTGTSTWPTQVPPGFPPAPPRQEQERIVRFQDNQERCYPR